MSHLFRTLASHTPARGRCRPSDPKWLASAGWGRLEEVPGEVQALRHCLIQRRTRRSASRVDRSIHHTREEDEGRYVSVNADENRAETDPVLDAEGAAQLLHVSTKTLLKSARAGDIPGRKVGREWRFARTALMEYLASRVSG